MIGYVFNVTTCNSEECYGFDSLYLGPRGKLHYKSFDGSSSESNNPKYSLESYEVLGPYNSKDSTQCLDGHSACETVDIFMLNGTQMMINFGERGWDFERNLELKETKNGVLVFSSTFDDDCDASGCSNIIKISGVVYPVKKGDKWLSQVKAHIELACGHSDEEGCEYGEIEKRTIYFTRK